MTAPKLEALKGGNDPTLGLVALSDQSTTIDSVKRTPAKTSEPQMRALRRLLGDVVLSVFPADLRTSVDKAFAFWMDHVDSYIRTNFTTPEDKENTLILMRAYAECAGDSGYTIRTVKDQDPCVLIWRAQTRKGTASAES